MAPRTRLLGRQRLLIHAVIVVIGAHALAACSKPEPPPPPPPTQEKVDQDLLDRAFHECFVAECDRAYPHVSELPPASPLRQTEAFRAIHYRYDADRLLHADTETDMGKRRELLESVANSLTSDPALRLNANQRLARLGVNAAAAQEVALNAATNASVVAAKEKADLLKKSTSKVAADQNEVRAAIEPKIFSGKATPEDVAMLRTVCKAQKDTACLKRLSKLILH
jgi:hypothetical protein